MIMARPKKASDEMLVSIVEEYYSIVACGDMAKMKFAALEAYSREKGTEIKEHVFRRNKAVLKRLSELKDITDCEQGLKLSVGYRNLDVDGFIKGCSSLEELKNKLMELDGYWKDIYEQSSAYAEESRKEILSMSKIEKCNEDLGRANEALSKNYEDVRKENNELKRENIYLRQLVDKYIMPELARELMRQANLPVKEKRKYLNPKAYDELIEPRMPLPFTGKQGTDEHKMTRQEKLIEEMKGIAEKK